MQMFVLGHEHARADISTVALKMRGKPVEPLLKS
jgi:hypothetical protein